MTNMPLSGRAYPAGRHFAFGRATAGLALAAGLTFGMPPAFAQQKAAQETSIHLAGSNTIGAKMALDLARAWAKQMKLSGIRVDAGYDPDEYEVIAEGAENSRKVRVHVNGKGTGTGIEPLLRGQADIWMASRPVREADIELVRKHKVADVPTVAQFQQPGVENVIALAGLAIIVNPRNPVPSLTIQQIKDIYSGRVTSWAQVGGPSNLPIGLYAGEVGEADLDMFCATVMGNADAQKCAESFPRLAAPRFSLAEDLTDAVAGNPAGIGFVDLGMKRGARVVPLGTQCGTGVEASMFRIKTDEYPLGRRLYLYTAPGRPPGQATQDFLKFALGPVGQATVAASGFAELSPGVSDENYGADRLDAARDTMDGGKTRVRAPDAKAFESAVNGADRLSITFRFLPGTNDLDSRADADVGRLAALMGSPEYKDATLTLVGFSGTSGDYTENRTLSRERAQAVRGRLEAAGVKNVSAVGVGPAAAVACNLDPATASLNMRVEVWIRKGQPS